MTWQELMAQSAWAGTCILLAAFAASWLLRKAPAAWRHFLWTGALAGLLALPALIDVTPKWRVKTPAPAAAIASEITVAPRTAVTETPAPRPWHPLLPAWIVGAALTAAWFAAGHFRARRMTHRAVAAEYARPLLDDAGGAGILVIESAAAPTAMAVGMWNPAIVLPSEAASWPLEQLRAVLLHELMHIRRRDLAAQAIAQMVCCLYWCHPLAWMAARQLRREREQACDDAVLGRGVAACEYAQHLVTLVRALRGRRSAAMTMAEPSELESRVRALLDGARDRRPLNRAAAFTMVAALALVLTPLAVITVRAQAAASVPLLESTPVPVIHEVAAVPESAPVSDVTPEPIPAKVEEPQTAATGSLNGTVQDPSSARIPGCQVVARNADGSNDETTTANAAGVYQFAALPPGRYSLEVRAPGFTLFRRIGLTVEAGKPLTLNVNLEVGSVVESMSIFASRPQAAADAPAPGAPVRIRVGGNVQAARILKKTPAVYPEDQKAKGITGTVRLSAIIGKDGLLTNIHALSGPEGLVAAAVEAASHWAYQPTLLNGEPVPVLTTIDIVFDLN